jgi:hypothetical protein
MINQGEKILKGWTDGLTTSFQTKGRIHPSSELVYICGQVAYPHHLFFSTYAVLYIPHINQSLDVYGQLEQRDRLERRGGQRRGCKSEKTTIYDTLGKFDFSMWIYAQTSIHIQRRSTIRKILMGGKRLS